MIISCGEALVDMVADDPGGQRTPHPGGAPANVAVAAARLGVPTAFCGRLSTDGYGDLLAEHLRRSGVRLELVERGPEPTAEAIVEHDPTPKFRFEGDGTADTVLGPVDLGLLSCAEGEPLLLHSGSLAMFRGSAAASILELYRNTSRALRSLDPNVRPDLVRSREEWQAWFDRWVRVVDLLRASDEDLRWIASDGDAEGFASDLLGRGPQAVIVTRGSRGATVLTAEGRVDVAAAPVVVVDTVGAGDSFTGGLLTWLHVNSIATRAELSVLRSEDWAAGVGWAQTVAAVTCGRVGADPPWAHDVPAAPSVHR